MASNGIISVTPRPKSSLDRLVLRFLDHPQLDTHTYTRQDSSERVISLSQRLLPTQHTTNILAFSEIGIRGPSSQAAAKLRLRLHSHRGRSNGKIFVLFHKIINVVHVLKYAGGRVFLSCTSYRVSK